MFSSMLASITHKWNNLGPLERDRFEKGEECRMLFCAEMKPLLLFAVSLGCVRKDFAEMHLCRMRRAAG